MDLDPLYRFDEGVVLMRDGDGVLSNFVIREEYEEWDWDAPSPFPKFEQIEAAVIAAAGPGDPRAEQVNPRALRPTAS